MSLLTNIFSGFPSSLAAQCGFTVLHFLWQGTALVLIWWAVKRVMAGGSPRLRYAVGLVFLALMAVAPVITFRSLSSPEFTIRYAQEPNDSVSEIPSGPVMAVSSSEIQGTTASSITQGAQDPVSRTSQFKLAGWTWARMMRACERRIHWLAWGWGIGVGILCLWHAAGWWRLRQWQRVGVRTLSPGLLRMAKALTKQMGLRYMVRFLVSQKVPTPVAFGWLRPVILLPVSAITGLDELQLRAIITHELAHLRRWDYLVNWAQTIVETLLFFHPGVWWLNREIRAERELCCDDDVLRAGCDRVSYVQALGQLAVFQGGHHALSATGGPLLRRMQRMLGASDPAAGPSLLTVFVGMTVLGSLTFSAARLHAKETPKPVAGKVTRGRILDRNNIVLADNDADGKRQYPLGASTGHMTGYVGRKSKQGDMEGRSGLEFGLEESLAAGQDVKLSLDSKLQTMVEQVMRDGNVARGAAVLLDPRDGSVLAMVSLPSVDPNIFVPKIQESDFKNLIDDQSKPLWNRAADGVYPPGSLYKLAVALAAVKGGRGGQESNCVGQMKIGDRVFHDWKREGGHGKMDLNAAIKNSCNIWFYEAGQALGLDALHESAVLLGFGERTGIEFHEQLGCSPDGAFLKKQYNRERVSGGDLANISIGQGDTLATPLQAAQATATLANGGTLWPNHLVQEIGGKAIPHPQRHSILDSGIKPADVEIIRQGMKAAVQEEGGVGHKAAIPGWEVAGQTGSAQWRMVKNQMETVSWFSCFAPYDAPRYALTVIVEGGSSGGATNAPLVAKILRKLQESEAGNK